MIKRLRQILLLNECGGDETIPYKFSDADGVRTGRSGYSFGISQFDIENNWDGIKALEHCGITPKELKRLFLQRDNIDDISDKLKKTIVDNLDIDHIIKSLDHCRRLLPHRTDLELAMLVDYHNQFYLSPNGKLHNFLKAAKSWNHVDIYDFKRMHTAWGS